MTEDNGAKTEGAEVPKGKHPDFPQWIKTKEGIDCMNWPISEPIYLNNRLFWAFDAGRNCVWDLYTEQKVGLAAANETIEHLKVLIDNKNALIETYERQLESYSKGKA
jgi:hypothetical protein